MVTVNGIRGREIVFVGNVREPLFRLLGLGPAHGLDRANAIKLIGLLILVAFILTRDAEVRLFLAFLNSLGVDIFLGLLVIQGRAWFWLLYGNAVVPVARHLSDLGPYPLPLPSRWFLVHHPLWAAYAIARLMAVGSIVALVVTAVVAAATSAVAWPFGKALGVTVLMERRTVRRTPFK